MRSCGWLAVRGIFERWTVDFMLQVPVDNRHEIYGLLSSEFRDWLSESYRSERGELPPGGAVGRVLSSLKARARLGREGPAVSVRVGRPGEPGERCEEYYIDLGDAGGRAVKISAARMVSGRSAACALSAA